MYYIGNNNKCHCFECKRICHTHIRKEKGKKKHHFIGNDMSGLMFFN